MSGGLFINALNYLLKKCSLIECNISSLRNVLSYQAVASYVLLNLCEASIRKILLTFFLGGSVHKHTDKRPRPIFSNKDQTSKFTKVFIIMTLFNLLINLCVFTIYR